MASFNAEEVLAFAIEVAKQAGQIILKGSQDRLADQDQGRGDWSEIIKKNTADLVTETDQATEDFIKKAVAEKYPSHKFIGEESWAAGDEAKLGDEPTWISDPIDGTTNYVKHFHQCCVSIGIAYQFRPVIGVVYAPFLQTLYFARKGAGAWVESPQFPQRKKLPLAKPLPLPSLRNAVLAVEYGSDRRIEVISKKMASFARLVGDPEAGVKGGEMVSGVRSIGSAALSCCYIASGAFDLWHEIGCWSWDVCAGIVILQEAGGVAVGSKESALASLSSKSFGDVTPEVLQGRKYLVVRGISGGEGESDTDAQKRIIKSFYNAIDEWDHA